MRYLMPKLSLLKNCRGTVYSMTENDKGFHTILHGVSPKVNDYDRTYLLWY